MSWDEKKYWRKWKTFQIFLLAFHFAFAGFPFFRGVVFPSIFYFFAVSLDEGKEDCCLFSFRMGTEMRSFSAVFLLFVLASGWKRKWNSASICLTLLCLCRQFQCIVYCFMLKRCTIKITKKNTFSFYCLRWPFTDWPIAAQENSLESFHFFLHFKEEDSPLFFPFLFQVFAKNYCNCDVFLFRLSWLCQINAKFTRMKLLLFSLNYCPCSFFCCLFS